VSYDDGYAGDSRLNEGEPWEESGFPRRRGKSYPIGDGTEFTFEGSKVEWAKRNPMRQQPSPTIGEAATYRLLATIFT
jgi:hypothetical protein